MLFIFEQITFIATIYFTNDGILLQSHLIVVILYYSKYNIFYFKL